LHQLPAWHAETGLIHGDCKPSQFLIGPAHTALLDFDHCGMADPASDVGTFLATLRQMKVSAQGPLQSTHWFHALEERFLEEYIRTRGCHPDIRLRATWYMAVALLRKSLRSFARSPRSPVPAALVEEAWRCLAQL
jgi:aminoglycoside phosphotransferase (APT) family kinase protein